jgi:DNA mismatch endonuclease (patch repair protein)
MDPLTPEQRHRCMSHIRSTETKPEIFFRKALWKGGVRYRKNVKDLFGKPDIAIKKYRLVIFIDGEFWHGLDWRARHFDSQKAMLESYNDFWREKITRNIARDRKVSRYYRKNGWTILRFREKDVRKKLNRCIVKTLRTLEQIKGKQR